MILELIIFDFDGTLIDSAPDLVDSINEMLKEFNLKEAGFNEAVKWIGNGSLKLVERALKYNGIEDEEFLHKAHKNFKEKYKHTNAKKTLLYPYAKELLYDLKKNYNLALITNKPDEYIKPILKKFDINVFDFILGGDFEYKKPSPVPLLKACEYFDVSPNETVMIGDSKNDILAAKNANIKSVALTHGYSQGENIKSFNPDFTAYSLKEIKEIINAM